MTGGANNVVVPVTKYHHMGAHMQKLHAKLELLFIGVHGVNHGESLSKASCWTASNEREFGYLNAV